MMGKRDFGDPCHFHIDMNELDDIVFLHGKFYVDHLDSSPSRSIFEKSLKTFIPCARPIGTLLGVVLGVFPFTFVFDVLV